ncbi:zinc-binding protein A33-like [Protopterus annectens]|uniref:zinc-binding protein A33-like n=1 Tax=Protopterus annectens TaxID=7888 RepID=UPI001CFB3F30|nr:zinc-binding protein A33-like [Protopterus annectens]
MDNFVIHTDTGSVVPTAGAIGRVNAVPSSFNFVDRFEQDRKVRVDNPFAAVGEFAHSPLPGELGALLDKLEHLLNEQTATYFNILGASAEGEREDEQFPNLSAPQNPSKLANDFQKKNIENRKYTMTRREDGFKQKLTIPVMELRDHEERYMKPLEKIVLQDAVLGSCDGSREMYNYFLHHEDWNEWKCNMRTVPSPLTLDPDTAHPNLILSEDLTSVRYDEVTQYLPDNPKRFNTYICVLGKEGFNSGRHYWEVEVKNKTAWDVGVTRESSNRKGSFEMGAKHGYWRMTLRNGNKYTVTGSSLTLTVKPQRIGVYLDYERGEVSLYNADNVSHIYTFTDKFTETIYPYFNPSLKYDGKNEEPMKLFHLKL